MSNVKYQMSDVPRRAAARRGQLIIEALAACSVLVVGLLGILTLLSQSLRSNKIITDNYVGTYLAGEGIEIVKNIIDHNNMQIQGCTDPTFCSPVVPPCPACNWLAGVPDGQYEIDYTSQSLAQPYVGQTLLYDSGTGLYSYAGGAPTSFVRQITIQSIPIGGALDSVRVASAVRWQAGLFTASAVVEDQFYNWRP